jgi:hypothetical protein
MTDNIFVSIFRNKRDVPVMIADYNGNVARLEPGEAYELKSIGPRTLYARFSEIVYKGVDKIELRGNPDWRNPYQEFWCLELANLEGAPSEAIQLLPPRGAGEIIGLSANNYIEALRGFPRIVPVDIDCKLIKYSRIEWSLVTEKAPMEGAPGYFEMRTVLKKNLIERPASELRKIDKERQRKVLELAEAEREKLSCDKT